MQDPPSDPADLIQPLDGHGPLVASHLEDTVSTGVQDGLAGAEVLFPQVSDDVGSRGRIVAQDAHAEGLLEGCDQIGGETIRIGWEGAIHQDAHHLPVPGHRVLAAHGAFLQATEGTDRVDAGPCPLQVQGIPQTQPAQGGNLQAADGSSDVDQRVPAVGARVPKELSVGGGAGAAAIHDQ